MAQLSSCLCLFLVQLFVLTTKGVSVNKCCAAGEYFDGGKCRKVRGAVVGEGNWRVPELLRYDIHDDLEFRLDNPTVLNCQVPLKPLTLKEGEGWRSKDSEDTRFYFTRSGVLLEEFTEVLGSTSYNHSINYLPNHYCIDPFQHGLVIRICPKLCNKQEPCLRKCCPVGQHFEYVEDNKGYETCVDSPVTLVNTSRVLNLTSDDGIVEEADLENVRFISGGEYGIIDCEHQEVVKVSTEFSGSTVKKPFTLHIQDGRPFYYDRKDGSWKEFKNLENHCFERVVTMGQDGKREEEVDVLFLCFRNYSNSSVSVSKGGLSLFWGVLYKVALAIAVLSLLLTTIVLLALIERQNIHTWVRAAYIVSQLISFTLVGVGNAFPLNPASCPVFCKIFAVTLHFSLLMTICWLSVINFDLWWTFRTLKPTGGQRGDIHRFLYYACFAVGVPLLVISIALIVQSTKPAGGRNSTGFPIIYPDYGEIANKKCTLADDAVPAYWFGPLVVLLLGNLVFFVAITMRMIHLKQMTKRLSSETSVGRYSFSIFAKIFIVSGVTWNAEIIGWLLGDGKWHWIILFHYAQAVALFIIFVCKREILRGLQKRYPIFTKITPPLESLHHSRPGNSADGTTKSRKLSTSTSTSGISHIPSFKRESYELRPTSTDFKSPSSSVIAA